MDFMDIYGDEVERKFQTMGKRDKRKLAIMCIERQFKAYCDFAFNKSWGRIDDYRSILDKCWLTILENNELNEEVWELNEKIRPENVKKTKTENSEINIAFANIFSSNIEELIETLLDDKEYEEGFLMLNIGYILSYINEDDIEGKFKIDEYKDNILIVNEINNQKKDLLSKDEIIDFTMVCKWCDNCNNLLKIK